MARTTKRKTVEATKVFYQRNPADGLYYEKVEPESSTSKKDIISALPEEGRIIAKKLGDQLQVTNEGNVIYEVEEVVGSPLIELMEWFLSKKSANERPLDYKLFEKLITKSNIKIPKSWIT